MRNPESNATKALVNEMLESARLSLTKAVKKMNELHPDEASSTQNISNKLSRDSISFAEVLRLAEACGFELTVKSNNLETKPTYKKKEPELTDKFKMLVPEGYTSIDSPNFGQIIIAGKNAQQAADFITQNQSAEMTDADELALCNSANNHFHVAAKPVSQNPNVRYEVL